MTKRIFAVLILVAIGLGALHAGHVAIERVTVAHAVVR